MCDKGYKWDMMKLQCVPDTSAASSGSSVGGGVPVLESILGNLPGILTGAGSFISATKGNPANVTNIYGDSKAGPGISLVAVGVVVALIAILVFVFMKNPKK